MNADSVKAKLKNFAVKKGCTFQEALTYYGLERTIYRMTDMMAKVKEFVRPLLEGTVKAKWNPENGIWK